MVAFTDIDISFLRPYGVAADEKPLDDGVGFPSASGRLTSPTLQMIYLVSSDCFLHISHFVPVEKRFRLFPSGLRQ